MGIGIPFGKFRLIRRMARGGMAEVFQATQQGPEGFERTVALKRILPHLAEVPDFVEMFMEEARLAAKLSHPNIAHVYEFGQVDNSYYITMELIDGVDLNAAAPPPPLPLEHCARIIADVCAALHHAHGLEDSAGVPLCIVHRDISPQNIMVSFDGAVKVLDFGIAKAAHHAERTQRGMVRGKVTYMSPEQVRQFPLDGRADLFCTGIVLHELCTGRALFSRTDPVEARRCIRNAQIREPLRDGRPLPALLQRVLDRSLTARTEDRYGSAAQMQLDLEEYLRATTHISNSIALGRFFKENFGHRRRSAGAQGPEPQGTAQVNGPGADHDPDGSMVNLASADLEMLSDEVPGHHSSPAIPMGTDQIIAQYTYPEASTGTDDSTTQRFAQGAAGDDLHSARTELLDGSVGVHSARTAIMNRAEPPADVAPVKRRRSFRLPPLGASTWILLGVLVVGVVVLGILGGYLVAGMSGRPEQEASSSPARVEPARTPRTPPR